MKYKEFLELVKKGPVVVRYVGFSRLYLYDPTLSDVIRIENSLVVLGPDWAKGVSEDWYFVDDEDRIEQPFGSYSGQARVGFSMGDLAFGKSSQFMGDKAPQILTKECGCKRLINGHEPKCAYAK